ncbi:ricin-type beta-trefoil lectin domain protein [Streptomyces sp. AM6-12]|uniref:ricin-type beta-trefoil lectin domain protein n=1 Tax=Streptomyces sp. AM6-12 TaxID=3345149 RepID=UPI003797B14F
MTLGLRNAVAVAILAVTASFLPSAGATAAEPGTHARAAGAYCLANTWNTPEVRTRQCNSLDRGQYWTVDGDMIKLTYAPDYCLANTWNTPEVRTRRCDIDRGQHWTVRGQQISLTHASGYCLANTWNTPEVRIRPCDSFDRGQHWTINGRQISLTYA